MYPCRRHIFSLMTAAAFLLLTTSHCEASPWAEAQAHFRDFALNISITVENASPDQFLALGLSTGQYTIDLHGPGPVLEPFSRNRIHPDMHGPGLNSRAPPAHVPT